MEDPSTIGTPESIAHPRTYQRYGMAWLELWAGAECSVASWLGGPEARSDERDRTIAIYPGATPVPSCGDVPVRAQS